MQDEQFRGRRFPRPFGDDKRRTTNYGRSSPVVLLYEHVAHLAQGWNVDHYIGLVVSATQFQALTRLRAAAPNLWFLAPSISAQGGDLKVMLEASLRNDRKGLPINISRSIAQAENPGLAAEELRDRIINIKRKLHP